MAAKKSGSGFQSTLTDTVSDFEKLHGPLWKQIVSMLTGLSWEQIAGLGGIKIYDPVKKVEF